MVAPSRTHPAPWRSLSALPPRPRRAPSDPVDTRSGRITVMRVGPACEDPRFPAKAFSGEVVPFRATVFGEGHALLGVHVRLTDPRGVQSLHAMTPLQDGFDRWRCPLALCETGLWHFRIEAFSDEYATWRRDARTKVAAGVDVEVTGLIGARLLDAGAAEPDRPAPARARMRAVAAELSDPATSPDRMLTLIDDPVLAEEGVLRPIARLRAESAAWQVRVDRERSGVGAWYEFFPRSEGAHTRADGSIRSGTFATAAQRARAVAAMGFDVLYLPPIHPIGVTGRKGRDNALHAAPGDPGSPWAIGSSAGGHDAVHPELGTLADFGRFVQTVRESGMEVALDLALQASPDHPWVSEHPEWFTTLPDGSIAHAENPPKKYEDIYPIDFDGDLEGLRREVLRIVRFWIAQGVRIFRVDNPHTKPLSFWEWLIAAVLEQDPDVVFLAEAFTRPAPLHALAMVGFQQSYSYFTWRNTKAELERFLIEISGEKADAFRPNLFVNTPDILTEYLQYGGRAAYRIRAAVAATAGSSYGVYAGFELIENVARPGSEENIDNEKYQYRIRDWAGAEASGLSLAPYLRTLNEIRRAHPALRQLRTLAVHRSDDDAILVYSKHLPAGLSPTGHSDTIIVVVNCDPHSVRESMIHLDTTTFGIEPGSSFEVEDLLTGARWTWSGDDYVRLDAFDQPVHIVHVRGRG